MHTTVEMVIAVVGSVFASSGFWLFIVRVLDRKTALSCMVLGLGHDRIIHLCKRHIIAGFISTEDFENLDKYLYEPYAKMGGNGTAKKYMDDVRKLPTEAPHIHTPHKIRSNRPSQNDL